MLTDLIIFFKQENQGLEWDVFCQEAIWLPGVSFHEKTGGQVWLRH